MVKVELHSHTNDDPKDVLRHSARELIDTAIALGYGALAITLHNRLFDDPGTTRYARDRGLTLIPSIELTIERCDVLLINVPAEAETVNGFDDLRAFKARHPACLVIAPHPFFPLAHSLGAARVERNADLWDAVEVNAFYTRTVDFNRRARRWAEARGLPLVGNGDIHQLVQLDTTYSLVDAEGPVTAAGVCAAIRAGRVRVVSRPISHARALQIAGRAVLADLTGRAW